MSLPVNSVNTDKHVNTKPSFPANLDGSPITYSGNPAHVEGVLHEIGRCLSRTGLYAALIRHNSVLLTSNGKMAIASIQSVPFIIGTYDDGRSWDLPCPADVETRIADWDAAAALDLSGATPDFTRLTTRPPDFASEYVLSPAVIRKEDTDFQVWLSAVFTVSDDLEYFLDASAGSGLKMIRQLRLEVNKSEARDRTLIRVEYDLVVRRGIPGSINLENFNAFVKSHDVAMRNLPTAMRPADETIMQMLMNILLRDTTIGDIYEQKIELSPPADLQAMKEQARKLLRSRNVKAEIDALERGGGEQRRAPQHGLHAEHAAQLAQLAGEVKKLKGVNQALLAGVDPNKDKKPDGDTRKRMAELMRSIRGAGCKNVPRRPDGRVDVWVPGMDLCACQANVKGTTDAEIGGAEHLFRDCGNPELAKKNAAIIKEIMAKRSSAGGGRKQSGKLALQDGGSPTVVPESIEGVDELSNDEFKTKLALLFSNVAADESDGEETKHAAVAISDSTHALLEPSPFARGDEVPIEPTLNVAYHSLAEGIKLGAAPPPPSALFGMGIAEDSEDAESDAGDDELATAASLVEKHSPGPRLTAAGASDGVPLTPDQGPIAVSSSGGRRLERGSRPTSASEGACRNLGLASGMARSWDPPVSEGWGSLGTDATSMGSCWTDESEHLHRDCPLHGLGEGDSHGEVMPSDAYDSDTTDDSLPGLGEGDSHGEVTPSDAYDSDATDDSLPGLVTASSESSGEDLPPGFEKAKFIARRKVSPLAPKEAPPSLPATRSVNPFDALDALGDGGIEAIAPTMITAGGLSERLSEMVPTESQMTILLEDSASLALEMSVACDSDSEVNDFAQAIALSMSPPSPQSELFIDAGGREVYIDAPSPSPSPSPTSPSPSPSPPPSPSLDKPSAPVLAKLMVIGVEAPAQVALLAVGVVSMFMLLASRAARSALSAVRSLPLKTIAIAILIAGLGAAGSAGALNSAIAAGDAAGDSPFARAHPVLRGGGEVLPDGPVLQTCAVAQGGDGLEQLALAAPSASDAPHVQAILAALDSGCTASCTGDESILINLRACSETYRDANGKKTACSWMGDLPCVVNLGDGQMMRMVFRNVRLVKGYTHTLLSVTQLWAEQRIDCRWADLNHMVLPLECDKQVVPFHQGTKLSSIALACTAGMDDSSPQLAALAEASQSALTALGFHKVGSHAHVGRMPAAKAGELCHRRWHVGIDSLRAAAQVSSDAPSNLKSATHVPCSSCAATNITKAAHGGTMPTPVAVPGRLHVDLKGPFPLSLDGYKYAIFFTDEFTRYVFVKFLKSRESSKIIEAVEQCRAQFNAEVGVPVDENGKTLERPRVFSIRTDHEGAIESKSFMSFRSAETIHVDYSAPHDHDLNGIAERVNRTIDELATRMRHFCGAPIGFWPHIIRHAVNVHNALPSAVGSSTADPLMSAHQRFTLKVPQVMDLCAFGCRAVALLPEPQRGKNLLEPRGAEGVFCGRSPDNPRCYEVWSDGRFISTSSVSVDEEFFPWLKDGAHKPLPSAASSGSQPSDSTDSVPAAAASDTPTASRSRVNHAPSRCARCLSLFSGVKSRAGGLADLLRARGWSDVEQIDNDSSAGGGWSDDLSNDRAYARILAMAKEGRYDAIIIAFPCSTFSFARLFDANTGKPRSYSFDTSGDIAPVLGDDGGPPPVRSSNYPDGLPAVLLDPKHRGELEAANLLLERIVDIAIAARSSPRKATIIIENPADRSVRGRPAYASDVGLHHGSLFATKAFHRLATSVGPVSQCTFAQCAFGSSYQKYTTLAYTNDAAPILDKLNGAEHQCAHEPGTHDKLVGGRVEGTFSSGKSAAYPDELNKLLVDAVTYARTGSCETIDKPAESIPQPIKVTAEPEAGVTDVAEPATVRAEQRESASATPLEHRRREPPSSPAPFAGWGRPTKPPSALPAPPPGLPIQGKAERAVRASTASARLEPVSEHAPIMEAAIADLVFSAAIPSPAPAEHEPALLPVSEWVELDGHQTAFAFAKAGASLRRTSAGEWFVDGSDEAASALFAQAEPHELPPVGSHVCLRAESAGAPSTHAEAMRMGGDWPKAEEKEMKNHANNDSWRVIKMSEKPAHRRLHKLVWVYKVKRDGTCKARLCVQGCTLQHGVDFDQTFASTLRYCSARALFKHAAENGCKVRSIDWVAAYLQGEFVDGEVVYCHLPPGHEQLDKDGKPMVCEVRKPIYGIPQAGRRLQRCVQPWLRDIGLRQLDDSDDCVWIYDSTDGETFAVGVYVDNLQIVHSVDIDDNGDAVDKSSFLAKFLQKIRADWEVVDEGPMLDLLGIQVEYQDDGGIKLHQSDYIAKLVQRFLPEGVSSSFKPTSLPYSNDFLLNIADALSQECQHPELIKEFQSIIGCLMYSCTSVRPDIAFVVHRLCTCLTRPTPALLLEARRVVSYLATHATVGLTYDPIRTGLSAYSDASWEDRRSTTGWVVLCNLAALSWGSSGQKCVSLSSCESEIVALSEAAKEVVYQRRFDKGLNNVTETVPPTDLFCDNTGARDLSYNPVHHNKTKHIARRHFFVRDMVEALELRVPYVKTDENIADFFTKPMKSWTVFCAFRNKIMNVEASPESN